MNTKCPKGKECTDCKAEEYQEKQVIKALGEFLNNGGTIEDLPRKKGGSTEPF